MEDTTLNPEGDRIRGTIAAQNDQFRTKGPLGEIAGTFVITQAINAHGPAFVDACVRAVKAFDAFNEDADPFGTHEMGVIEVAGEKVWFRIDLYDTDYEWASPDPTDPEKTRRVMTILFPSGW